MKLLEVEGACAPVPDSWQGQCVCRSGVKSVRVWLGCSCAACEEALCAQHKWRIDVELEHSASSTSPPRRLRCRRQSRRRWIRLVTWQIPQLHVFTLPRQSRAAVVTAWFLLPDRPACGTVNRCSAFDSPLDSLEPFCCITLNIVHVFNYRNCCKNWEILCF